MATASPGNRNNRYQDRSSWVSKLSTRLLITYLALGLLGIGGLVVWTGQRLEADIIEKAIHEQTIQAQLLTNVLVPGLEEHDEGGTAPDRSLLDLLAAWARGSDARVTLFDTRLEMVVSSDPAVAPHVESDAIELQAARNGQNQHDIRRDPWRGEMRAFVAAPVLGEHGDLIGVLQLSRLMLPIQTEVRRMWIGLLSAGAVVLLVFALASILLARWIARPIQKLTTVTDAFAQGYLDHRVSPSGPSEIQRLGRAFNRMSAQLAEMINRQNEFVANASHELRSPLAGIKLRVDVLQAQGRGNPQLTERYLAQIEREVGYLQRISEQLLALAEADYSGATRAVDTDLAPLVYDLIDDMAPLAGSAGIRMNLVAPLHLPPTCVDPQQVRVILRNLLDNAIKYTPSGGQVTVEANTTDQAVAIKVIDNGVGIPEEALAHVFDRFYRVDKARARTQGGSGLGLALARSLTEANGGAIAVASRKGEGTVFTLAFPTTGPLPVPRVAEQVED